MHSGIDAAYSRLKAQMDALDTLANNLANLNTAGFKEKKAFFQAFNVALETSDASQLESAVNSTVSTGSALNLDDGSLVETHRDLDVALEGIGFLTVETPSGVRYTRNGSLTTNARSVLCTANGFPVLGESGPIVLSPGKLAIRQDGQVLVDGKIVGQLKLTSFDNPGSLNCEGNSLFIAGQGTGDPKAASNVVVRQGYQEQSNVNPVLATVRMIEIQRQFDSIQKAVSLIFNEMDAKAIDKLGR